jgi:hypothetical protein
MVLDRDGEILELKKRAHADYRELGKQVGESPSAISSMVGGWRPWKRGARERLISFLRDRIRRIEAAT